MALAESYTIKPNAIPAYFDAMLSAQPPERFSVKFLENLGFTSTNDRVFLGVLKDLGFLNRDGAPEQRYFEFLDTSRSRFAVAEGVKDAFSDLFAINIKANELGVEDVKNKLRTLFAGRKTDLVIGNIARTFRALCDYGDFAGIPQSSEMKPLTVEEKGSETPGGAVTEPPVRGVGKVAVSALQYHLNIVLPDTRDQAVYDAIFRSLREHLG